MYDRSNRVRRSFWAAALALVAGPVALAGPADEAKPDRIVLAMYQQGTTGSSGTATKAATPKAGTSIPTAAPKAGADAPSALPKAGANSTPTGPGVGASRNPFRPQSVEMIRQANRLKAAGYGGNVMNDGEIVLALNATIKLLGKSEDEYRGHRTKAIQEIENAIHQIKTKAGKAGAKNAAPPRSGSKSTVPQAESDAYLREAHKALEKIVFQINHGGNVKRLAPARGSVQKAMQELSTALEAR